MAFVAAPAAARAQTIFPLDHFWSFTLDAPFAAAPAVDERHVYVALQTGRFIALLPGASEPVWSVELTAEGAPLAADNRVFVPASGAIHALDAASGSVMWRLPASALAAPLEYRSGWLVVALADGSLQAVRAADGVVVWARAAGSPLAAAPSIDGDLIAVGFADGRLALIDLATGKSRWEKSLGARPSGITLSGDRIFLGSDDGHFWSVKTRDGDVDWRWQLGTRLVGAPAADADRVYVVALDNVVRGYARGSGHMRWHFPLTTRALAGPMIVERLLVITTGDVGAPGLTFVAAETGKSGGNTPAIVTKDAPLDETVRVQFPARLSSPGGSTPFAIIATSAVSGGWMLHAYRKTDLAFATGPIVWGPLYEIRRRLDLRVGAVLWGARVTVNPPAGYVVTPR